MVSFHIRLYRWPCLINNESSRTVNNDYNALGILNTLFLWNRLTSIILLINYIVERFFFFPVYHEGPFIINLKQLWQMVCDRSVLNGYVLCVCFKSKELPNFTVLFNRWSVIKIEYSWCVEKLFYCFFFPFRHFKAAPLIYFF